MVTAPVPSLNDRFASVGGRRLLPLTGVEAILETASVTRDYKGTVTIGHRLTTQARIRDNHWDMLIYL